MASGAEGDKSGWIGGGVVDESRKILQELKLTDQGLVDSINLKVTSLVVGWTRL